MHFRQQAVPIDDSTRYGARKIAITAGSDSSAAGGARHLRLDAISSICDRDVGPTGRITGHEPCTLWVRVLYPCPPSRTALDASIASPIGCGPLSRGERRDALG